MLQQFSLTLDILEKLQDDIRPDIESTVEGWMDKHVGIGAQ